jgi:hypothetical protein
MRIGLLTWRIKRVFWAVQLFGCIVWRKNYNGSRLSVRDALRISRIGDRLVEMFGRYPCV